MFINLLMTNHHTQLAKKIKTGEVTQSRHSEPSANLCKRLNCRGKSWPTGPSQ
ncbi:hypothetical protein NC653_038687 [Populus alba x Populus x berolinensis]|uniref:Uncharacterized protein n=1 Tax=Populus alba x Populus x berolinensis TaxID=444605 RepID=A0AAD6LK22_9ROSI|nr:hypothetical protein NC653_038687 [Populus alba x Populus x berolinensis]